jgi:CubicO group peptidase (beta-lactamase class C family)
MDIHGHCDAKFEAVKSAFSDNFTHRDEIGASVAVVYESELVVDLWGGHKDEARTDPWMQDTIVNAWSLGKAMTALSLLRMFDETGLSPESRLAEVWPEFSTQDKGDITFGCAMAHRAGLCAIEAPMPDDAFMHWDVMTNALEAQKPWWEPDTAHGYHTNTLGFLLGEPLRRKTGKRLRDYFREKIANPLGAEFHMGVENRDLERCADVVSTPRPADARPVIPPEPDLTDPMTRMRIAIYTNPSLFGVIDNNSSQWRQSEFPSTSPQSNARSVARIFGEMASTLHYKRDGLIRYDTLARATEIASDGEDLNLQRPTRFGLGLQLTQPDRPLGPNPGTFGHYGNGGHLGFADPTVPLAFAYHMNLHGYAWRDPRNIALTDAVYASL